MSLSFRFAIISDLHIALPHTIREHPKRLHLVEVSIPVLETILERLSHLQLDFLLLPGDLTQHGELDNHAWLIQRLKQLPYPVYVIPGNHDIPVLEADGWSIAANDFPRLYQDFGYTNPDWFHYTQQVLPGVRLIGLNSNTFDANGKQMGQLDAAQLQWLEQVLAAHAHEFVMVMIHHNVVDHLPHQSKHPLGQRYILNNAAVLRQILRKAGVQLVFTGHLHVQDIAHSDGVYDITTGSLVTYPHPYRVVEVLTNEQGQRWLHVESGRVEAVDGWATLPQISRDLIGDRSDSFMVKLLTSAPLHLPLEEAMPLVPDLRYFWAEIADGDGLFDFSQFPPKVRRYFESFSAIDTNGYLNLIDNAIALRLS
ncbi:MAG TPA: metallophosphoesterase [Leptolyngbyaceae cyanobacterium M33_DOE_097]|uniref:Metallophosphoesterase n=1 Tax=Oscillatoriales cyanobacterium SpSt-418 TaxID=2282169 RepID=A0A7C3KEY3_9CYAN|nr:metallophosphoesterase [Leptolyngbyaceae cyanobacterium M33_DOE_097]